MNGLQKLIRHTKTQNVIGFSHIKENWESALEINNNVEIVDNI